MAQNVGRRTREIGVRIALGAPPSSVAWLVTREALLMASAGVAIGIPLTLWLAGLVGSQLYGVMPTDPSMLAGASLALVSVAAAAAVVPSRRAASIEPAKALQSE
jgi:ABC-type antimicrobial peptide transport system permease subunit